MGGRVTYAATRRLARDHIPSKEAIHQIRIVRVYSPRASALSCVGLATFPDVPSVESKRCKSVAYTISVKIRCTDAHACYNDLSLRRL